MTDVVAISARRTPAVAGRRSLRGRLLAPILRGLASVLQRLPDRALHRLAHAAGGLLHAAQPARRRLVRSNLQRVCRYLAEHDMASERIAAAAAGGRALDRLAREAFGHYVRSYLEGAIVPAYARSDLSARVVADDPGAVFEALGPAGTGGRAVIIVGLHFGAIEVPAAWATSVHGLSMTTPMETVADPDLQRYFQQSRSATGLRVIPTEGAGRELAARLAAGEAVAIVADRVVAGAGMRVELFGAPARLPLGPAVLAIESGAPVWLVAARRTGWGQYRARIERLAVPAEGTRRQRVEAFLAVQARGFERVVADAPEQWWSLFFPIWDERPAPATRAAA